MVKSSPDWWKYTLKLLWQAQKQRPVSFYLIIAMIVLLLLGAPLFHWADDARSLAFIMTLYLTFFLVIICRAGVDMLDIYKANIREHNRLLHDIFEKDGLARRLGEQVQKNQSQS